MSGANPGPWQHYLPAAYVGGFSAAPESRLRDSPVWVARKGVEAPYRRKAHGVAAAKHLYTLKTDSLTDDPFLVDRYWSTIESGIPAAIASLIGTSLSPLSADVWVKTIVPFIAHSFARGVDVEERIPARLGPLMSSSASDPDYTNLFRLREAQTMLTVAMRSEWTVLHLPPGERVILNDVGRVAMWHMRSGRLGYALPLRSDAVLVLTRGPRCAQLRGLNRRWIVDRIAHVDITFEEAASLNVSLAKQALYEVYCADRFTAEQMLPLVGEAGPMARGDNLLFESVPVLREYMALYLFALSFLSRRAPGDMAPIAIHGLDWNAISKILPVAFIPAQARTPGDVAMERTMRAKFGADVYHSTAIPLRSGVEPRHWFELGPAELRKKKRPR